jgi:hypothetical protein
MAITEITPTTVTLDTGFTLTQGAGTAINTSNTMEIPYPKQGKLLITIDSDHADTEAVLSAGYGVAGAAGSLAVGNTIIQGFIISSDKNVIAVGDGASAFKGCVQITWATNSAGYIRAFYLP